MFRKFNSFFQSTDTSLQHNQHHEDWLSKIHTMLTTHNEGWIRTNQGLNLLSAALATYIIVSRPSEASALTVVELATHLIHGMAVTSDSSFTHDKLIVLNVCNILYSTMHHLAYQQSNLSFAKAMTEVLFNHLVSNIWMNLAQVNQIDKQKGSRPH